MNTRLRLSRALAVAMPLLAGAGALGAQTVRGTVVLPDGSAAAGVIVIANEARGGTAVQSLTGENGGYELRLPAAGRYELRVLRIGFRPTVVPAFDVGAGESASLAIALRGDPIVISPVTVQGRSVCKVRQDSGQTVADLWQEARKAITATQLLPAGRRQTVKWTVYDRNTDLTGKLVLSETNNGYSAAALKAFVSLPPDSLAKVGYMSEEESGTVYRAPDADALLSDAFAALHCFRVEPPPKDHAGWIGIGFRPARKRDRIVEIEGTLWLDRVSLELRQLEFRYANLPDDYSHVHAGGVVEFLRLSTGGWLVGRWQIRMPRATRQLVPRFSGGVLAARDEYRMVVEGLQFSGGAVTGVSRGLEVLFGTGESTHDFSPVLMAEDATLSLSCANDPSRGDRFALLRGTVFEGEHRGIAGASIRLTWRVEVPSLRPGTYAYVNERRDTRSDASGEWYVCGVPRENLITVRAAVGDRGSAPVTVRIPKERAIAGVDVEVPPP